VQSGGSVLSRRPTCEERTGEPVPVYYASAYAKHSTADVRSPRQALDGFNNYSQIMIVIAKLKDRDCTNQDGRNILGKNYMRAYDQG
jgi:microsomal dipeptidase-like Zn-dependent dipeptidase